MNVNLALDFIINNSNIETTITLGAISAGAIAFLVKLFIDYYSSRISKVFMTGTEKATIRVYRVIFYFVIFCLMITLIGYVTNSVVKSVETKNEQNETGYSEEVKEEEIEEKELSIEENVDKETLSESETMEENKDDNDNDALFTRVFLTIEAGCVLISIALMVAFILYHRIYEKNNREETDKDPFWLVFVNAVLALLCGFGNSNLILVAVLFPITYGFNIIVELVISLTGFLFTVELSNLFFNADRLPSNATTKISDKKYFLYERVEDYFIAGEKRFQTECKEYKIIPFSEIKEPIVFAGKRNNSDTNNQKEDVEHNQVDDNKINQENTDNASVIEKSNNEKCVPIVKNDNSEDLSVKEEYIQSKELIEWKRKGFNKVIISRKKYKKTNDNKETN